ncbi:MAG: hypothetical protein DI606_08770 [Sphingobium sp.]|uniref:hypothetical protein n=1 Tax=Sphingobium sp. TaxID=1912891 RepID=UPI000DB3D2E1|nr:hypothetical protein [Sphingobium sp.]PZU12493.1 MAG: hypothetical protein DI606_08770 [Sphingobium sp.]
MATTIFWAWQSDHDPRTGRHLIKSAIEEALKQLATDASFDERPQIDHDTKDVPGLAAIAETIFKKIDRCSMFIADLTPIASRPPKEKGGKRKWVANPNVLIELGYAKHVLGYDPLILVWNAAHRGTQPTDLPFDVAHRRAPIAYRAAEGCSRQELDAARKGLATDLRAAISLNLKRPELPALSWSRQSIGMPGLWFDRTKLLPIIVEGETQDWRVDAAPKSWMRILPATWPKHVTASDLPETMTLGRPTTRSDGRITGAAFTWSGSHVEKRIRTGTAWFPSDGEIWGFDSSASHGEGDAKYIVPEDLLDRWFRFLKANQDHLRSWGSRGPYLVQLGFGPLTNVKWRLDERRGRSPISAEETVTRQFHTGSDEDTIEEMWQFYRMLCDAFGRAGESFDGFRSFALGRLKS